MNREIRDQILLAMIENTNSLDQLDALESLFLQKMQEQVAQCIKLIRNTDLEDVDGGDSSVLAAAASQVAAAMLPSAQKAG
jgi:hypothetical protein